MRQLEETPENFKGVSRQRWSFCLQKSVSPSSILGKLCPQYLLGKEGVPFVHFLHCLLQATQSVLYGVPSNSG